MAKSIHPRNHQPPVYEMDRVIHFLKNRVGYTAQGLLLLLLLLLLLSSHVFYSYSLWLKLNRKRQFSLYLFIYQTLLTVNFSVIILISGFRIPGFRVAEVSRLPLIKENKSKKKTLRVDMLFLIEARFDRIRTSYRQKTKAAIGIGKCRWICDFIGILNLKSEILESDTRSYGNRNRKIPIASSERKISDNDLEMPPQVLWFG